MRHPFAVLLWKEWREGWPVMTLLWIAAPLVNLGVFRWLYSESARGTRWSSLAVGFLSLAAALVGGRLFASEEEAGTIHFVMRHPVRSATVWAVKLAVGVAFLAVLYCAWIAVDHVGALWGPDVPDRHRVFAWVPVASFSAALLLSTMRGNTVLACVGGFIAAYCDLLVIMLLAELRRPHGASLAWIHYVDGMVAPVVLGSALLCLALSYAVFRVRVRA